MNMEVFPEKLEWEGIDIHFVCIACCLYQSPTFSGPFALKEWHALLIIIRSASFIFTVEHTVASKTLVDGIGDDVEGYELREERLFNLLDDVIGDVPRVQLFVFEHHGDPMLEEHAHHGAMKRVLILSGPKVPAPSERSTEVGI